MIVTFWKLFIFLQNPIAFIMAKYVAMLEKV